MIFREASVLIEDDEAFSEEDKKMKEEVMAKVNPMSLFVHSLAFDLLIYVQFV